jgi:hypothetical protein
MSKLLLRILNPFSYKDLKEMPMSNNKEDIGLFSIKRNIGNGVNKKKKIYIASYNNLTAEYTINNKNFSKYEDLIKEALTL